MQVRLKVLRGKSEGKEVKISGPEFLVGRGKDCQLRPRSDVISRHHCIFLFGEDEVRLKDLGSRNGTFVNGKPVVEEGTLLSAGDHVRLGKLEFELVLDRTLGEAPQPKVKDVKEAVARGGAQPDLDDTDIAGWLAEADEDEIEQKLLSPDTRQFKLDDTDRVKLEQAALKAEEEAADKDTKDKRPPDKKQSPGKLPKQAGLSSKDSREAAAQMLRRFFNNR